MVYISTPLSALLAAAAIVSNVMAHPGEHHDEDEVRVELVKRNLHAQHIARGLEKCAGSVEYQAT